MVAPYQPMADTRGVRENIKAQYSRLSGRQFNKMSGLKNRHSRAIKEITITRADSQSLILMARNHSAS